MAGRSRLRSAPHDHGHFGQRVESEPLIAKAAQSPTELVAVLPGQNAGEPVPQVECSATFSASP